MYFMYLLDRLYSCGFVLYASPEHIEQLGSVQRGVGRYPGARGSQRAGPL